MWHFCVSVLVLDLFSCTYLDISVLLIHNNELEYYVALLIKLMNVYNKYNKGNKRIEVVGRNANFVLLGI